MKHANTIKCVIVDDQIIDQIMVKSMVAKYGNLQLLACFSNPNEAIKAIPQLKPDLLFLDVEMPDATGIELLKTVRAFVPMAVFITSFADFALESYELSALDYILKPITENRFDQCINRVQEYWEMKNKSNSYDVLIEADVIFIKQGHDKMKMSVNDIVYLEAMHDYTKIYTPNKSYITLGALSHFLALLPTEKFIRIHRSYAVARNKITAVKKNELHCDSIILPISKSYKESVNDINR